MCVYKIIAILEKSELSVFAINLKWTEKFAYDHKNTRLAEHSGTTVDRVVAGTPHTYRIPNG